MGINTRTSVNTDTPNMRVRNKIMRSRQFRTQSRRKQLRRATNYINDIVDLQTQTPYFESPVVENKNFPSCTISKEVKSYADTSSRISGIPHPAVITNHNAPVHIDVGGTTYTTTLSTLTKYPESKLAKIFNGTIDITLDSLKHNYFIDRDGAAFRHILNYLRYDDLVLPTNYTEVDILQTEAKFYELNDLVNKIKLRTASDKTSV